MAAYTSLKAFVAYGQLYDLWWNQSKDSLDWEQQRSASETCCHEQASLAHSNTEKTSTEAESFSREHSSVVASETGLAVSPSLLTKRQRKLGGCRVLLSEEYAALQSTRRDISRVQQTVAAMISQHQKNNLQESATNKSESESDLEKPPSPPSQGQK